MGVLTLDVAQAFKAGILTNFDEAFRQVRAGAAWNNIASDIPTTLKSQDYSWLGAGIVMEELIDEPREQALKEGTYTLADKTYKGRLSIPRTWLEDDMTGLILNRISGLASVSARHSDKICFQNLVNGFSTLCHDGQYFFDTDHNESGSNQSNTSSNNLSDTNLQAAHVAMAGFLDENGEPLGITPDTLVVGPLLERRAMDLLGSQVVVRDVGSGTAGSGATAATGYNNYFYGKYKLVVSPWITNYNWFLLHTSGPIKPVILQTRSDVPVSVETDLGLESAMMNEKFKFDVRERKVVGYGPWFYAYGAAGTA